MTPIFHITYCSRGRLFCNLIIDYSREFFFLVFTEFANNEIFLVIYIHCFNFDIDCFRENTVEVHAFVRNSEECQSRCSENAECGYYKYFPSSDVNQPLFCYHLRKCAPRVIRRAECPLEKNNYIDHFLFVDTQTECKQKCQEHTECRFWYWYPIDYSPAPMYCYLYRSCEGGADEQVSRRSFWTFNPFSTKVLNTALALLLLSLSLILHIIRDVFKYFFIIIAVSASIVYSILFLFFLNKVFKVFEYSREKQTVFENQPKCFVKIQSFQMPSEFSRRNWPKLYFIKGDFFLVIFKYCEAREGFLSK